MLLSEVTILWIVREIVALVRDVNPWRKETTTELLIQNDKRRIDRDG